MSENKPTRVQLSRKKGWRMPPNTVKVDRTTPFGNPFPIGEDRAESIRKFEEWIESTEEGRQLAERARRELCGKNLACWCSPNDVCHADVLIRLSNETTGLARVQWNPLAPGLAFSREGQGALLMSRALMEATIEVGKSKTMFYMSDAVDPVGMFVDGVDLRLVRNWLKEIGANESDSEVLYFICRHTTYEWLHLPKRTIVEHRLFEEIEQTALRLAALIEQTDSHYVRAGGHGLQHARISDLLSPIEEKNIVLPLRSAASDESGFDPANEFPTVEEILVRLAAAARRIAKSGPLHPQPNKAGAMTGYFVRRMGQFLKQRYKQASPHTVLAALASMSLGKVVDDEMARKDLRNPERSKAKKARNVPGRK